MRRGLKGNWLPENASEAAQLLREGALKFRICVVCKKSLHEPERASTPAGWREAQISGTCEPCFDGLFSDENSEANMKGD